MAGLDQLENSLSDVFVKKAPPLPEGGKKAIVQYLPWLSLLVGLLTLFFAWQLWHWAHVASALIDEANSLSQAFGGTATVTNRMSVGIWLGVLILVVEGVLYLMAFSNLQARKKAGWNLLFYALLINLVYGIVIVFTSYGGIGNFLSYLIGSVIGLYFLFQIRSSYSGAKAPVAKAEPKA